MSEEDIELQIDGKSVARWAKEHHKRIEEGMRMLHREPVTFTDEQKRSIQDAIEREIADKLPRDTQFAGFARLLAEDCAKLPIDLKESAEEANARFQLLLAQRAYDLMKHMMNIIPILINNANIPSLDAAMQYIPDMAAWPEEE